MSKLGDIIHWYENFSIEKYDLNDLLRQDQLLSIELAKMGKQIAILEGEFKTAYVKRKVTQAEVKLMSEGTVADRESTSIVKTKGLRIKESKLEGKLKGYKIMFDSGSAVANSMSRWIKAMQ